MLITITNRCLRRCLGSLCILSQQPLSTNRLILPGSWILLHQHLPSRPSTSAFLTSSAGCPSLAASACDEPVDPCAFSRRFHRTLATMARTWETDSFPPSNPPAAPSPEFHAAPGQALAQIEQSAFCIKLMFVSLSSSTRTRVKSWAASALSADAQRLRHLRDFLDSSDSWRYRAKHPPGPNPSPSESWALSRRLVPASRPRRTRWSGSRCPDAAREQDLVVIATVGLAVEVREARARRPKEISARNARALLFSANRFAASESAWRCACPVRMAWRRDADPLALRVD